MDKHCVVMFEFAHPDEGLDASGQVNEVFGPFDSGDEAEIWVEKARRLIPNRHWLITPMSQPNNINACDPTIN